MKTQDPSKFQNLTINSEIKLKLAEQHFANPFAMHNYYVTKSKGMIIIHEKDSIQLNMSIKLNRAFKNSKFLIMDDNLDDEELYSTDCTGPIADLIHSVDLEEIFPDIKNSWRVRSAYSGHVYCEIGTIKADGKELQFCLRMSLSGTMTMYIFKPEDLSKVLNIIDDNYCIISGSLELNIIREAC